MAASEPLWKAVVHCPASSAVVAVCVGVWLVLMQRGLGYEAVGVSYTALVRGKQLWRVFTASLSHIDLLHLVFNLTSLWSLRFLEVKYGALWYLRVSYLLLVLSIAFTMLQYHLLITWLGIDTYADTLAVGYSCVVFGLMTVAYQLSGATSLSVFGLFSLPLSLAPFGSLLLTQLLVPRASFSGHLSGILVGYLYSWGLFSWVDGPVFFTALFWTVVALLWSLKTTSDFPLPWIQCIADPAGLRDVRVVNGVLGGPRHVVAADAIEQDEHR